MTLPPYPKYKPSGVEWLGEVPEHWEVKRLKYWARRNPPSFVASALDRDTLVCFVPMEAVGEYGGLDLRERREIGQLRQGFSCFEDGDVVVAKITPCFENGKGALIGRVPHGVAFGTTELHVLRPFGGCVREYLFYLTLAEHFRQGGEAEMYGAGGQKRVPAAFLGNTVQTMPSVEEQRRIVAFLAVETAGLDVLTGKQLSLLERMREKRAALITRTVTRGLPPKEARAAGFAPAPPLRASGVEWLGDIPAHWEVKRLKYLATINDEALPDTTPPDHEMQYVDIGSVDSVKGVTTSELLTFESAPSRARRIARDGDTIVSTVRTYLRAIAAIRDPAENLIVSTGFAVVRPRRMEPAYLSYAARESRFVETVVARSVGVSYPAVNASEIATIPVPRPPEAEQRAIADYLDRETAKLDRLIGKVETAIERLREYRSALITAVVTGKVDVRGASGETGRAEAG